MSYVVPVRWVRGFAYELRWERGFDGIRSRQVDSVAELRAVVEWVRRNPHIEKCSYKVTYLADGELGEACSSGHSLLSPKPGRPWDLEQKVTLVGCSGCGGHYVTVCPTCGERSTTRHELSSARRLGDTAVLSC